MSKGIPDFAVLGAGPYSLALADLLKTRRIRRRSDGCGWQWPKEGLAEICSCLLVVPSHCSPSSAIRWHRELWLHPPFRQARTVVICLDSHQAEELRGRDLFGRMGKFGDSFSDWGKYILVVWASAGISSVLPKLESLMPLPVRTWARRSEEASIVPAIITAIESRERENLTAILDKAIAQDWDVICPGNSAFGGHHEQANLIRRWLASVTDNVTISWEDGIALFKTLSVNKCKPTLNT